jgi:acyl carrier protein
MGDGIEGHVRRVVARQLGVPARMLEADSCLRDDLAGDVQTLHDVVLAVERRLGVRLEARILDEVRSYGELVAATIAAIGVQRAQLAQDAVSSAAGRVRITGPQGLVVERAGSLTPYVLESVCDDARRGGPGTTLAICVDEPATDDQLAGLRERVAAVERRGVIVQVTRRPGAGRNARKNG